MNIEELAFKDRKILANLNAVDLLNIIEFLQDDRRQCLEELSKTHNRSVEIQKENQELKSQLAGTTHCFDEEEHNKLKEEITNLSKDVDMWNAKYNDMFDENRMLKKQVEEKENIACNWKDSCLENAGKIEKLENQQKKFIEYLENKIYSIEPKGTGINYYCEYDSEEDYISAMKEQSKLNTLKEILSKYKSIIGGKDAIK